jgi:hypothetical protein
MVRGSFPSRVKIDIFGEEKRRRPSWQRRIIIIASTSGTEDGGFGSPGRIKCACYDFCLSMLQLMLLVCAIFNSEDRK